MRVFVRRAGRVLSRDQLLQLLSGRDAEAYDRSIDMQVVRLRRKIEPDPKRPTLIVTVPNSGYKFAATVRQVEAPAVPKPDPAEVGPGDAERRHVTALAAEVLAAEGTKLPDDPEELGLSSMPGATTRPLWSPAMVEWWERAGCAKCSPISAIRWRRNMPPTGRCMPRSLWPSDRRWENGGCRQG